MPTALGGTPSRLPSRWKSCCFVAIRKSWTPTSRTTSGAFRQPLEVGGRRIVDRRVLHLIKMWLDCPVEETDKRGRKALVQMAAADQLHWRAELAEVVDGQAEGGSGAVRGSPLRPRSHHPVRALVSSVQAQSARLGEGDGRARPVDSAYDHHALGAALCPGVRETLAPVCPGGRPVMAGRRDLRQDPRRVALPISGSGANSRQSKTLPLLRH